MGDRLWSHRALFGVTALFLVWALGISFYLGRPITWLILPYIQLFGLLSIPFLLLAGLWRFGHIALHVKPKHPLVYFARDFADLVFHPSRWANGLPVLASMFVMMSVYVFVKANIPTLQPFAWDKTFMEMDLWLHFGWHPWELTQALFGGSTFATFAINFLYHLWYFWMFLIWFLLAFAKKDSTYRQQFFVSFILTWFVGGSILAVAFSSAGPCYYGFLGLGVDPYKPLFAHMAEANQSYTIWALDVQKLLWDSYTGAVTGEPAGISAMPSMHNATSALLVLVGFQMGRGIGWAFLAFATAILLGSVHLGWHYAVDSYAGILVALAMWWAAGWIVRRTA